MQNELGTTANANPTLSRPELLNLYALSTQQEHFWHDQLDKRTTAYATLILGLIVATVAGFLQAEEPEHFAALLAGPALVIVTSRLAIAAAYRLYQRFLEAIAFRSKLEELLEWGPTDAMWKEESLVYHRYIESRRRASRVLSTLQKKGNVTPGGVRTEARSDSPQSSRSKLQKSGLWLAGWLWPVQDDLNAPILTASEVFVELSRFGGSHQVVRRLFEGFYLAGIVTFVILAYYAWRQHVGCG